MKNLILPFFLFAFYTFGYSQADCPDAIPACTTPQFALTPNGTGSIVDFTNNASSSISNPQSNVNPGNVGCILGGENNSTFITINCVSSGTLEWSIQGTTGNGFFDWIMWPVNGSLNTTCTAIQGNTLAPVSCNWNGASQGFTGMAMPGNLPPGANQTNFENGITVTAGAQFLLYFSNFSSTNQSVALNFFGSSVVSCGAVSIDQTICAGDTAHVTIGTPGYNNPSFNWLVTTAVGNTSSGTNVPVYPAVTTAYQVVVHENAPPAPGQPPVPDDTTSFTVFVVNPPVPNAGLDDTVCFGQPIPLSGTISNASDAKLWLSFNSITPTPSVLFLPNFQSLSPNVTVSQPGLYGFVLRQTNPVCGQRKDTVMVFVKQMTISPTFAGPSCFGNTDGHIQVSGPQASEASYNNGNTWTSNLDSTGFLPGTYNICVRDINGCQACTTIVLPDGPPMQLIASADTIICENGTATLSAYIVGASNFDYYWSNGVTANTQSVQINPSSNGFYSVYAQNANGCISNTDSILVLVRPPLSGTLTPDFAICPGDPITLTATAANGNGGPFTFTWDNGPVGTGSMHEMSDQPVATQTFTVTISDACESTPLILSSEVEVLPGPDAQFTVDTTAKCEPAIFYLQVTTDPATFVSSTWTLSDGQIGVNLPQYPTTPLSAGIYDVELVLVDAFGCVDELNMTQYLNAMVKPHALVRYSPNTPTMFSTKVQMDNLTTGATTYDWFLPGGQPSYSSSLEPEVMYPDGVVDNYPVRMIATSDFGCIDTANVLVEILPEFILYVPNTFTPDNDEFNQKWGVFTSGIDVSTYRLTVFDRWGNVLWHTENIEEMWDGTSKGEYCPTGVYIWSMTATDRFSGETKNFSGNINLTR